ncbi:MAG: biotin/lipoate A/B protein ligase family protein [Anaerolineales bacterium]
MEIDVTSYPHSDWRLLINSAYPGAHNMAVDETVLESVGRGDSLPTLRLYAWEPACISLGYAQSFTDIDPDLLNQSGWDIVRRPTGGRAILHIDELTYSVIAPHSEARLAGSILESYYRLSLALLAALHMLDIPAKASPNSETKEENHHHPGNRSSNKHLNPVCFEVPSSYEITALDKKLIGSAQARRKEGILQHGSLPLYGDLSRITRVLKFDDEESREKAAARLLRRATTVESVLGIRIEWEVVAQAFVKAFQQVLNINLIEVPLTRTEEIQVNELVRTKYSHQSWIKRI